METTTSQILGWQIYENLVSSKMIFQPCVDKPVTSKSAHQSFICVICVLLS